MSEHFQVRQAAVGSPEHTGELTLRFEVLRRPLGMARGTEVYKAEASAAHFVAVTPTGEVIGCVVLHLTGEGSARLLQMAVAPGWQGRGVGRELIGALEAEASARGVRRVTLHSRVTACGFYERLGYTAEGEPYTEVTLPHQSMVREL